MRSPFAPQLARSASSPPAGDDWIHEIKYDGYRLVASVAGGEPRLFTRNGKDWTERLAPVAAALAPLAGRGAWLDGELVRLRLDGTPDYERLAGSIGRHAHNLVYQVWDLVRLEGRDVSGLPLLERKQLLLDALQDLPSARVRYVDHIRGDGAVLLDHVRELDLEGIVSKRADSPYRAGMRHGDWLKCKCTEERLFAIVGYTTRRNGSLRALVLAGLAPDERLVYAGKVNASFDRPGMERLLARLCEIGRASPTIPAPATERVHWVDLEVGAKVESLPWEPGTQLRHAVFLHAVFQG